MILLDPDLDSDLPQQVKLPKRSSGSAQAVTPRKQRIPNTRSLARFLREAQSAVKLRGQVTVLLTTDAAIRRLNLQFRGKNKATDVLSFPADVPGPIKIAGDLAISVNTARRQADERGHSLASEIKVLTLHGLLHLAGYDHEADSGDMARREQKLRAKLRLPQGLIERTMSITTKVGAPSLPPSHRRALGPQRRRREPSGCVAGADAKGGLARTSSSARTSTAKGARL
jgi:probable rRNA maturation factor